MSATGTEIIVKEIVDALNKAKKVNFLVLSPNAKLWTVSYLKTKYRKPEGMRESNTRKQQRNNQ